VVIASLIVLLPGLALTLSLNELGTGHLVSGTARFAGAIMTFMKIGIGAAVGRQAAQFLPGEIPHVDPLTPRSEERRVGKECRSRWSPYH